MCATNQGMDLQPVLLTCDRPHSKMCVIAAFKNEQSVRQRARNNRQEKRKKQRKKNACVFAASFTHL
jgi:hypothetical protein